MIWFSVLFLIIGISLLAGSSGVVISNILLISDKRKLRKSVLSFLLVAFSTSLPELFVALNAISIGNMSVSLGDILGSNITNICLIVGTCAIIHTLNKTNGKKLTLEKEDIKEFRTGLMILSVTLLSLLYLQYISRLVGILLLGIFFGYSYVLIRKRQEESEDTANGKTNGKIIKESLLLLIGLFGVLAGARFTLDSAIDIATFFGVPASLIGATLVAFGTSLPEFVTDARASYRGHMEITLGDIIGSCFLNSTLILGLLLTFTPFGVNLLVLSDLILFSVVSNLLLWFFIDNGKIEKREGFTLLILYCVNLLIAFGILVIK
ncbi:MAG: cation:H+ antiporter [Thermoproteota archaeon]|nr:cation:H+ antiporter [Thermoproteota archaeon]